jgi:hypothetical protein
MWCNSLRTAVFAATLIEYLTSRTLLSLQATKEVLGSERAFDLRVLDSQPIFFCLIACIQSTTIGKIELHSLRKIICMD